MAYFGVSTFFFGREDIDSKRRADFGDRSIPSRWAGWISAARGREKQGGASFFISLGGIANGLEFLRKIISGNFLRGLARTWFLDRDAALPRHFFGAAQRFGTCIERRQDV